jgi:hypothetical protein
METNKNEYYVVSVEDTIKYGAVKAAIIGRVRHWCQYNEKHNVQDRFHINFWWSGFMSAKEFAEQLGIKQRTIEDHLSTLLKDGVLVKGCFNKRNNDRTGWYRINPNPPTREVLSRITGNGYTEKRDTLSRNTGNGYTEKRDMDVLDDGTPLPVSISVSHSVKNSVSTPVNPPVNPSVEDLNIVLNLIRQNKFKTEEERIIAYAEKNRIEKELKKNKISLV